MSTDFNCFTLYPVGPGGSPDENGETTLDALIMNGVKAALPTQATTTRHAVFYVSAFMVDVIVILFA